ncbi:MAG: hypothetical protein QOF76_501 [Solirubrobacteraceae bacterium]|jgi:hypothetical protein|nr:hypothetical protein [Solirubrobacteraceae bacterium]
MSAHELRQLLDEVPDTRELVLRHAIESGSEYAAWSDAHEEAEEALRHWHLRGGAGLYAAYRAAQDREDAAQDSLALASGA